MNPFLTCLLFLLSAEADPTASTPEDRAASPPQKQPSLIELAEENFLDLTKFEKLLFVQVDSGDIADFDSGSSIDDTGWNPEERINANRLEWLLTDKNARTYISPKGVRLKGAFIDGTIDINGSTIDFMVLLQDCVIKGDFLFYDASLKMLNMQGTEVNEIVGDRARFAGGLFLRKGFEAHREVSLAGTTIEGDLDCQGGIFHGPKMALNANAAKIGGNALLCKSFLALGEVHLKGANITGELDIYDVVQPTFMTLDLRSTTTTTLKDSPDSWPKAGNLRIHGFKYSLAEESLLFDTEDRIRWLRLQYSSAEEAGNKFQPQPYGQLAEALRASGQEAEAKQVLMAREDDRLRYMTLPVGDRVWRSILGWTIGYGHQPWMVSWYGAGFIALGAVTFQLAYKHSKIICIGPINRSPHFSSIFYSIDAFIPVINLHQSMHWTVKDGLFRIYLWFHIVMGWVFSSLLILGFSGLVTD